MFTLLPDGKLLEYSPFNHEIKIKEGEELRLIPIYLLL
jgi:hypothetical protein